MKPSTIASNHSLASAVTIVAYTFGLEHFAHFKNNVYKKRNGLPFKSTVQYVWHITTVLKEIGISEQQYFGTPSVDQHEAWIELVESRLKGLIEKKHLGNRKCAMRAYLKFLRFQQSTQFNIAIN